MRAHLLCLLAFGLALVALGLFVLQVAIADGEAPQSSENVNCAQLADGNYVWGCSRSYSSCVNGTKYKKECQPNLVFSPETNRCQAQKDTPICTFTDGRDFVYFRLYSSKEHFSCGFGNVSADGLYEVGSCASLYIKCQDGHRTDLECPTDTFFVQASQQCEFLHACEERLMVNEGGPLIEIGPNGAINSSVSGGSAGIEDALKVASTTPNTSTSLATGAHHSRGANGQQTPAPLSSPASPSGLQMHGSDSSNQLSKSSPLPLSSPNRASSPKRTRHKRDNEGGDGYGYYKKCPDCPPSCSCPEAKYGPEDGINTWWDYITLVGVLALEHFLLAVANKVGILHWS